MDHSLYSQGIRILDEMFKLGHTFHENDDYFVISIYKHDVLQNFLYQVSRKNNIRKFIERIALYNTDASRHHQLSLDQVNFVYKQLRECNEVRLIELLFRHAPNNLTSIPRFRLGRTQFDEFDRICEEYGTNVHRYSCLESNIRYVLKFTSTVPNTRHQPDCTQKYYISFRCLCNERRSRYREMEAGYWDCRRNGVIPDEL